MKMAIQPISRTDYVSHVSFGDKHKKGKNKDGGGHMTPAAKAIPIVVLMSMSPLTQCATAENYNRHVASYPTTEVVTQTPQEPKKKGLPHAAIETLNGEYFGVWGVSDDDNPDDAEAFLFKYRRELGNNKVAVLTGQFLAVSKEPREDGKYLMMYSPLDESGFVNGKLEIMYVPQDFGALGRSMVASSANTKRKCRSASWESFLNKFGENAVNNAPNIEDATNLILNKK